jgi:hypothetical protein
LQDAGILKQVFFDNRQSYYEVIAGRQAYDYLICVATGRVIEFASEKLKKASRRDLPRARLRPALAPVSRLRSQPEGKALRRASSGGASPSHRSRSNYGYFAERIWRGSAQCREGRQREDGDLHFLVPEGRADQDEDHERKLPASVRNEAYLTIGSFKK